MTTSALKRVITERSILLLEEPFWGTLALRLKLVEDQTCLTAWTDGETLAINPTFIMGLTSTEVRALIAHEVMHCADGHPWRRDGRERTRWDQATDRVINPILRDAGFTLPAEVLFELAPNHLGKSAEWVYDRLPVPPPSSASSTGADSGAGSGADQNPSQDAQDGAQGSREDGGGDMDSPSPSAPQEGDSPDPSPGSPESSQNSPGEGAGDQDSPTSQTPQNRPQASQEQCQGKPPQAPTPGSWGEVRDAPVGSAAGEGEARSSEVEWGLAVQQAAALTYGQGTLPSSLTRFVESKTEPYVDWRSVLRRFLQEVSRMDYSWQRPNPRYLPGGMYLPALRAEGMGSLVVAIDTSGSIDQVLLAQFQAELQSICEELRPERTRVLYCDAVIQGDETFHEGEEIEFRPCGGGGTDFRPVFDAVRDWEYPAVAVVYLTDLKGMYPTEIPEVPVLWATPTTQVTAPFGDTVLIR